MSREPMGQRNYPPSVTLAIPAYNAAWCLPRLLASAHKQTIPFDEILVYDDCSIDSTIDVCLSMRATVIRGDKNIGCSAAKNILLARAKCDWIHFHDADDELLPNFMSLARKWAVLPSAPDVILFDYEYRDNESGVLLWISVFPDDAKLTEDPVAYAIERQINPFCGLYRTSSLRRVGGYEVNAETLLNEDVAFHCKLALNGLSFDCEHEVAIINYRVEGSMSQKNKLGCCEAHFAVMRHMAAQTGSRYAREIATRMWYVATVFSYYRKWTKMDAALMFALRLYPQVLDDQISLTRRFRLLCKALGPRVAFRVREKVISSFKPQLRTSFGS
jgi:glycosyltransferase involved in cell wall biosynthesis